MSKAYKCDRCGRFYNVNPRSEQTIKFNFSDGIYDLPVDNLYLTVNIINQIKLSIDLCQYCLDEFCNWYNKESYLQPDT